MGWRRWNNAIHRDLGYLCFGLTLIYALSGIAVNHIKDWNPSYLIEKIESQIAPVADPRASAKILADEVLQKLGVDGVHVKSIFQPSPETLQIFLEGNTITANLLNGKVVQEKVTPRPVLYEVNFLHLNHPKKLWTILADIYAVALALLAITGLFVLKGKRGITGRGAWLAAIGLVFPLVFLLLYL